jgi:hypothetical protein
MSDLTTRLNAITSRQDDTNAKLDAILAALGAPPPTATVTLVDVINTLDANNQTVLNAVSALNTSNQLLGSILLVLQSIDSNISSVLGRTTAIATNTDVITARVTDIESFVDAFVQDYFSGSGTKQLIENIWFAEMETRKAIIATACACDTDGAILPIPPNVNPFPTEEEQLKCKRAQKFVEWFEAAILTRIRDLLATYGVIGASAAGALMIAGLGALAPSSAGATLIPAIAITSIVLAVGNLTAAQASGIVDYYNSDAVRNALTQAIFTANDANQAKQNWDSVIDGFLDVNTNIRALWKLAAIQLFFNETFDLNSDIDVTGYDGTLCGSSSEIPYQDIDYAVQNYRYYLDGEWHDSTTPAVVWTESLRDQIFGPSTTNNHTNKPIWFTRNINTWRIECLTGQAFINVYNQPLTGVYNEPVSSTWIVNQGEELYVSTSPNAIVISGPPGTIVRVYGRVN